MPIIAIIGSVFFMLCGTGLYQLITQQDASSFKAFLVFMGLFVILMAPSFLFYNKDAKGQLEEEN
jgi:FtsH-binding integral membrane protein